MGRSVKNLTTSQEEAPFFLIDLTFSHLKFDAHLHGKQELMFFKKRSASLFVNLKGVVLDNALHSIRTNLILTSLDGVHKEGFVPVQTELIHDIDLVEIIENEE